MKLLIITIASAVLLLSSCCGNRCDNQTGEQTAAVTENVCDGTKCCNADSAEIAGIRKTLDLYCEAAVKGDSKIAEPAFAPTATISHVEDGKLISLPIKVLYEYYDTTGPHNATYEITSCNVAEDVAVVSIDSQFGDASFADMFTLAKDGVDWKIISKIFHAKN